MSSGHRLVKEVLTSWWTGKHAPRQVPLKIEDFSSTEPAKKRFFFWKMGFTKIASCPRCIFALPESATPTVNSRRILWIRRMRELESMVPEFVARTRGSRWSRALPARVGNADKSFSENSGKPKKPAAPLYGGWFRVLSGGSRWLSALPTGSMWVQALPGLSGCGPLELSRVF